LFFFAPFFISDSVNRRPVVFWAGQYAVVGAVFDPAAAGRAPAILDVFAGRADRPALFPDFVGSADLINISKVFFFAGG
jgi:hypothetical protein